MARRKGEITPRRIDRDFPHQVELAVPVGGFRKQLDDMHGFCLANKLAYRTHGAMRRGVGDFMRWCFSTPSDADVFSVRFGGERVTVEQKRR